MKAIGAGSTHRESIPLLARAEDLVKSALLRTNTSVRLIVHFFVFTNPPPFSLCGDA